MKKRHYITYNSAIVLFALVCCSCATRRHIDHSISVSPNRLVLYPDSTEQISMDISFNIPKKYIPKRNRLFIVPQLLINKEKETELTPLIVDAPIYRKKAERKKVIEDYYDPYEEGAYRTDRKSSALNLKYHEKFSLPQDMDSAMVRAIISSDGCGECSAIDTILIAPVVLINVTDSFRLKPVESPFIIQPKIRYGQGEAIIQFIINRHDINMNLGNNRKELGKIANALQDILSDSLATINTFSIYGMASADGPYMFNTALARRRAASAKQWLTNQLHIKPEVAAIIKSDSRPEGWWPVYRAMVDDGHPDSLTVKQILIKYANENDDVAEKYIRRLKCWKDIRDRYLQKDRKTEYTYSYTIRNFTDDNELLAMYKINPEVCNESELLRVSVLAKGRKEKADVYRTILRYFPQSATAANNLSILYLENGQTDEAEKIIKGIEPITPEMANTLAVCLMQKKQYEEAEKLLDSLDTPEAQYNRGMLKAMQHKLNEAYRILKDYRDLNSAIVAINLSRLDEAKAIMNELNDTSAQAEYIRALIAARLNNTQDFVRHLTNACRDEKLKKKASEEADFKRMLENGAFENDIIK